MFCPNCDNNDIEMTTFSFEEMDAEASWLCVDCGHRWTVYYEKIEEA